ncbi:High-affinity leucine-specific transport system, periplasmic binding protein LivK [Hyalangium minutum]|uniref:High-affinity leucine-specific transport system, periplasmic binding protein LivK n=1 Tax=Hyalangium minutum TaxID=394096 RepID=A0A085W9L4_9BACT|nr:High-affinity leucine-specific transport system, periplasmic binding protein LivK [Hyalangium minutum]
MRWIRRRTLNQTCLPTSDARGTPRYRTSAELYDPATGTWSPAGSMATTRVYPTMTLLPSGKVLSIGGSKDNSAELYTP